MPKAHIQDGELRIRLTDDIREKLGVREGEELNAHVLEGSVTFTRAGGAARREAGKRILALTERIGARPGQPDMSEEEVNQMINEEAEAYRHDRRNHP